MSSTLPTETKEDDLCSTTQTNTDSIDDHLVKTTHTATEPPTAPTKKQKKKKKNTILYQQTAVKYYNGFMKNKRYKKGINLSTGCAVFKTAWELPESNGLILPSRVLRHFKQVLPKKPPPKKKRTKKKPNTQRWTPPDDEDVNPLKVAVSELPSTASELPSEDPFIIRSRTMQNMHSPSTLTASPQLNSGGDHPNQHVYNRTMLTIAPIGQTNTVSLINAQNAFCDQIEAMIDEQKFYEDTVQSKKRKHMISKSVDITQQIYDEEEPDIDAKPVEQDDPKHNKHNRKPSSPTVIKPKLSDTDIYDDHAHMIEDDLKPDVEEQPVMQVRAQTVDVREMRDHVDVEEEEEHKEDVVPKKKKKKKNPVLYAQNATKLYKKINDGKRFKKGITLRKACHIFSVAWELPEDNGRILPSKVARHFKQVLPSKKTAKKVTKSTNIKPSLVTKTNNLKPQTMRGHAKPNWLGTTAKRQNSLRRSLGELSVKKDVETLSAMKDMAGKPKVSMISHLEDLIVLDPNRTRNEENGSNRRVRAGTMTDLELDIDIDDQEHEVVENEIEQMIEEQKKLKKKENDAINAIDASFGL